MGAAAVEGDVVEPPINPVGALEFIVAFGTDAYEDLDWWSITDRGDMEYWVDYEYMRLHIRVRLADLR